MIKKILIDYQESLGYIRKLVSGWCETNRNKNRNSFYLIGREGGGGGDGGGGGLMCLMVRLIETKTEMLFIVLLFY